MRHLRKIVGGCAVATAILATSLPVINTSFNGKIAQGRDAVAQAKDSAKAAPAVKAPVKKPVIAKPQIEIAILLDTSNSMDGLINQAKTHLWSIVNTFATAKQNGVRPNLKVALFEYGNSRLPRGEGYIRQVLGLSDDLDKVSQELFALRTSGGNEYCGQVIQQAVQSLQWSKSNKDFKAIFIAGNEPFTQGSVPYGPACKAAIAKGIVVNTIFCGNEAQGVNGKWKDGAVLADGSFININQNRRVVHIAAPQDKDLIKLNSELNKTYVSYGAKGKAGAANQKAQDANAEKLNRAVLAQRVSTKVSSYYSNARWDLCDAIQQKKVKLEDIKEKDLPANMQKMSLKERRQYIEKMMKSRAGIKAKIKKLSAERSRYVAVERKKQAEASGQVSLDSAIANTVRKQAAKKNFKFEKQ